MDKPYSETVERAMLLTLGSLNERQRRLYVASEALKLGRSGVSYVAQLFGCHRKTVQRGLIDLRTAEPSYPADQARKKGVDDIPVFPFFPDWTTPS